MFNRYIEREVIPLCDEAGIGQVVFSPLAQGVLTGKYKRGQQAARRIPGSDDQVKKFVERYLTDENLARVEQLEGVAKELGITLPQLALAWVLRLPSISSALIGASRPEQIVENVKAIDVKLDESVLEKIEEILKS